jgi:hypothetical protein
VLVRRKLIVSFISITISLICLPFILGLELSAYQLEQEGILYFFQEYFRKLFFYGIISIQFILIIGIPVTIFAGYITGKLIRFKTIVNFMIHTVPAFIFGILFFQEAFQETFPFYFIMIPVIIASIFFAVDEIYIRKKDRSNKFLFALVPILLWGIIFMPGYLEQVKDTRTMNEINELPLPKPEVSVNEETAVIEKSSACWDSDESSGCPIDKDPLLLPIDHTGINEFKIAGEAKIRIAMKNTDLDYKFQVYYLQDGEVKRIDVSNKEFVLPANIQEQIVKVTAIMENSQRISFPIGIRNGNRS